MTAWMTTAVLALGTIAIKATGPLAFGRRQPSAAVSGVIVLIAPSLLAALVVYETVHAGAHGLRSTPVWSASQRRPPRSRFAFRSWSSSRSPPPQQRRLAPSPERLGAVRPVRRADVREVVEQVGMRTDARVGDLAVREQRQEVSGDVVGERSAVVGIARGLSGSYERTSGSSVSATRLASSGG